jgi:hypothetical protein
MEPAKLETTIGSLYVRPDGRDRFTLEGPFVSAWTGARMPDNVYPHVDLRFERQGAGRWANVRTAFDYRDPSMGDAPIPQALLNELSQLGIEWANAHPEEFEKAARAEFDDHILYITRDTFDELTRIFTEAQKHFREILDEPEFANYASMPLRRRVQKEAQRLRSLRSQASGAAKAISTLAGAPIRCRESNGRSRTTVNRRRRKRSHENRKTIETNARAPGFGKLAVERRTQRDESRDGSGR